ncbi:MAG: alpha-ketoglutaric semialdehyde dehydrogenase [Solirubrobacteraceae bacterium]|jgi:aldehyde dehydrogenase (NAD+)|nr:alpha-ketoglutaric semialdehyde dehydrogenase [Solirubrobacteraceae bacterium]
MADTMTAPANFIAGEWRPSAAGDTYEKRNPARPDEAVGEFPSSTREDVDLAVEAADAARRDWAGAPIAKRAAVLTAAAALIDERAEAIAQDMTREMGKPLREARMEAARAAQILRYSAGEAFRPVGELYEQAVTGGPVYTVHRPVGVVGLITPWNFPAAIPVWKLAPALIYGNTIVLKLAQDSPLTGLHVARALDDAGIPGGVLNVVIGRGADVGTPLVEHPGVRAISFTGSVPVGEGIREQAGRLGKRAQLELGGHNPLIVMADADLPRAAEAAYAGAFWSAGQKCTATRRIYVQDAAYDAFREAFLARVESGKVGDPADPETEVGPLVNEKAMEDVLAAIERGRSEGGRVLAGGERADDDAYLVAPTVFEDVADDAMLSCEEVFGPVTSLYRFGALDDAIARANAVEFGLSAAIFTSDLGATQRFVNELEAGILHVNSQTAGADVHVPFGGVKGSGFGPHEQGRAAREFYTEVVTVYQDA